MPIRPAAFVAALCFAGCLPATAPLGAATEPAPDFRPEVFFSGQTRGRGVLTVRGRRSGEIRVESRGAADGPDAFRLDQTVTFPDGRVVERTWTMRALGDGRYTSTLTPDARGTVETEASGPTFRIRYRMGRGLTMDQTLTLRPGGQTADNVATVRLAGIPWARLTETITRVGAVGE